MGKENKKVFFKVSLIWNQTILEEKAFNKPQIITIGEDSENSFTIYSEKVNLGKTHKLFVPEGKSYRLNLIEGMEGDLKINNVDYDLKDFMVNKCEKKGDIYTTLISPFDSGYIDIGEQTFSWAFSNEIAVAKGGIRLDKIFLFYLFIAALIHLMLILYVAAIEPVEQELTFTDIPDRFAKIIVQEPEKEKKEEHKEKKKVARKSENIGKRMGGIEGKIGNKNTAKHVKTRIPKSRKELITKNLKARGVFGAVSGSGGFTNITDDSGPNVSARLQASFNGTSGNEFVAGRGSGGTGFRGRGTGGGGTGYGRIGGTGDIDTGGGRGTKVSIGSLSKSGKKERKVPKLKKGRATYSGFCKKSDIQKVVSRKSRSIRFCYEKELQRRRNLKGKVKLVWVIGLSGKVESVSILQDTMHNSRMNSCFKRQIKRWRFNKPQGGKCKIAYPFVFSAD